MSHNKCIRRRTAYLLYTVLFVFYLTSFIYDHVDAELSVIYAVHVRVMVNPVNHI